MNNKYIKLLESEIIKRDELIYLMMHNTHNYQSFMLDKSIGIDELIIKFKSGETINSNLVKRRIESLHKNIIKK